MKAIIGRKIGMTRIFDQNSQEVQVSLISAGPCTVTQIKSANNDQAPALQIGYGSTKKNKKPQIGHLKKVKSDPLDKTQGHPEPSRMDEKLKVKSLKYLREFIINKDEIDKLKIGDEINVGIFKENDFVDISGISKGKGFSGVRKRHKFTLGPKTHGSDNYRLPGSIGSTFPQRTIKGKRMAGHKGAKAATVKNLKVMEIDVAKNLLVLKGSIPGPKNSLVVIKGK